MGKRENLAKEFLIQLYSAPVISPRETEQKLKVTAATSNRLISELEKLDTFRLKYLYTFQLKFTRQMIDVLKTSYFPENRTYLLTAIIWGSIFAMEFVLCIRK